MAIDYDNLKEIDDRIRQGEIASLKQEFKRLNCAKIPRKARAPLANFARRIGLLDLSVRILNRVIRSEVPVHPAPKAEEICEYGFSLVRIGAKEEGISLLRSREAREFNRSWLYEAFALISQWDYAGSIPRLQEFIQRCEDRDSYQQLVAKVNLVAAYAYIGNAEEAMALGERALIQAEIERSNMLKVSLLIYLAELSLQLGNERASNNYIEKARTLPTREIDHLFCDTLRAIYLLQEGKLPLIDGLAKLDEVEDWARRKNHWNTVRRCDKYRGIYTKNTDLLIRNYFGTPYTSFREDILKESKGILTLPESVMINLIPNAKEKGKCKGERGIDYGTGEAIGLKGITLKPDQLIHRMFQSLCSDLYAPIPVADLHFKLYPGEFFNPDSSYNRVYNAIYLLREWITEYKLPLKIEQLDGNYRMTAKKDFCILRRPGDDSFGKNELQGKLQVFVSAFGEEVFSAPEAAKKLDLNLRKVQRILKEACETGQVEASGGSKNRRYRFRSDEKKAA